MSDEPNALSSNEDNGNKKTKVRILKTRKNFFKNKKKKNNANLGSKNHRKMFVMNVELIIFQ